jgi:hypothetical protein|tara:strand:- start:98 stop:463 length:366 start_codon:yes stop_codon:yes gene_type:complete
MKIMTTSASSQTMDVIPRSFVSSYTLKLRDTSKNKQVFSSSVSASSLANGQRITVTFSPVLKEGRTYDMELLSGSAIVYKDKIFCTDQTINQANNNYYDINSGEYTFDETAGSHDNDYIIV